MTSFVLFILAVYFAPMLVCFLVYAANMPQVEWYMADSSSTGLAPDPAVEKSAIVQIYSARAYGWLGIFAVHTWLVFKEEGADQYSRYDVAGWGETLRFCMAPPDSRWCGNQPEVVEEIRGESAKSAIPKIQAAIASYPYIDAVGYIAWPGPNSNSFVANIIRQVPELRVSLPPKAIGKDFAHRWLSIMQTPSKSGWQVSIAGYFGMAFGIVEGLEFHVLGQTLGVDLLRPAIKVPALGRIGISRS